jgi:cyclase
MWTSREFRRRDFILGCAVLVVGLLYSARGITATGGFYKVLEVKPQIFAWIPDDVIDQECDPLYSRAAAAGFIVTTEGVVVVDTANSPMNARDLLYEIRRRTDQPIRYVLNTSSAGDHMLGNEVFTDEQATLVSTKQAQTEMLRYRDELSSRIHSEDGWKLEARMRGFHITPTTVTFDQKMMLTVGGQEIRMISLLAGDHSPEDSVVFLPAAKTLFLGELFDNQYFPRVGGRDVHRWIDVLRQVETWDVDTYIPGHGAPGTKKDVADFRKFLEWLVAAVDSRLKQGQSPADVQKGLWLPRSYNWHAPDLSQDTVADVCKQLAPAHAAPTPAQPSGQ